MTSVTISIMCYNYGEYLPQAIESALGQTGHDLDVDVLVIDDGSTDNTPEVCQRYASSIRTLRSSNQGFAASLTRSIREAQGEYVCLLDADDYFVDTKLRRLEPCIRHGDDLIEHPSILVDETGDVLREEPKGGGSTSTLCIRRKKALDLLPAHNEVFFHALKHLGRAATIDEPLTYYRVHGESMIRSQEPGGWYDELASVTHALADHLATMSGDPPAWTDASSLAQTSQHYRAIAHYDEMEAALQRQRRWPAMKNSLRMLYRAAHAPDGIQAWHWKLLARCLRGRAIETSLH
jgi:glycosyltransferase involved in cell wall biosynthesis